MLPQCSGVLGLTVPCKKIVACQGLDTAADLNLVCASSCHSQRRACGFSILWTLELLPHFVDEETKVQRGCLAQSHP